MNNFNERLVFAMQRANMSKADLARKVGISPQAVGALVNGASNGPNHENLIKIARALRVSSDWLGAGQGDIEPATRNGRLGLNVVHDVSYSTKDYNAVIEQKSSTVPLISRVQAGKFCDSGDVGEPESWLFAPLIMSGSSFALRVTGISMEPHYMDGDIIYVDPEVQHKHNDDVVVRISDSGEATFKRLQIDETGMYLIALNKNYPAPIVPLGSEAQICGVVVFSGKFRAR